MAARFKSDRPNASASTRELITRWWVEKTSAGVEIDRDLAGPPLVHAAEGRLDVIFVANGGSKLWEDWLVLTDQIADLAGLEFEGFEDRVSGVLRPTVFRNA